jgi:hypothetical protein
MGGVKYSRAYYHCDHCHQGWFFTDEELGIERKRTPGCREVVSLTGNLEPFAEAAERLLVKLTGLNVSASTVRRVTEAVGNDVAARRAAGETLGPATPWDWERDADGKRVAYVGLDATSVPQQGQGGKKAEGRMPWVGSVFNPQPMHQRTSCHKDPTGESSTADDLPSTTPQAVIDCGEHRKRPRVWPTRYVSGVMTLAEIGRQLRCECQAVGIAGADVVIGLTDGGNGLETCLVETVLSGLARETVLILDFFHASEHVHDFAKTWQPNDAARHDQLEAWCHLLKHAGGQALLAQLEALDLTGRDTVVREAHRQLTGYVRNNLYRMDYPTYIARGWQIGSGEIESACKGVVNRRLKGTGMRWGLPGTTELCQLRALYRSESILWDAYWHRITPA